MKCSQCKTENVIHANYCKNCGHPFFEKDREETLSKTIYGTLDKIETWWSNLQLKFITDHIIFRVFVILVILVYGLFMLKQNGAEFRIADSEQYRIQYNTVDNEYYLLTEYNEIGLNLYIPFQMDQLVVEVLYNDQVLRTNTFTDINEVILESDSLYQYHLIASCDNEKEELYMYVVKE